MKTSTPRRVRTNTAEGVNDGIRKEAERRIAYFINHPDEIAGRLAELDEEWDVERAVETHGPAATLQGVLFGAVFGRKWLLLPLLAQSMMLLHAVQGYYPLLPLFRRMGFRTPHEIATERYALKAIRGDFERVDAGDSDHVADQAFAAARP